MHLCTFAVGKGEMPPVFFSKIGFAPFGPLCPARFSRPPPKLPIRSVYTVAHVIWERLYIWQKVRLLDFLRLSVYAHVNVCTSDKVKLLDFSCLSVCRSGKPLHTWQGWNPMTSLIRCSTHMWEPLNLAKVRVLDFRTLSVYTFVHGVASSQRETLRLPQFVCARICQHLHIWQKGASSISAVCLFTHRSSVFTSGKGKIPWPFLFVGVHICERR